MIGSCALGCPLDTIDVTLVDAHKSAYNPIQPRDDLRSRKRPGHEFRNEIARKQKSFFKETAADIYGSPLTLEEKKRQKGSTSSAGNDRWQVSPEHQSRYNITLAEQKLRSFRVDYVSCFFSVAAITSCEQRRFSQTAVISPPTTWTKATGRCQTLPLFLTHLPHRHRNYPTGNCTTDDLEEGNLQLI